MVEMGKETEETEKETDGYMEREKTEANRQADRQLKYKSVGTATASPLHDVQIMKRRYDRSYTFHSDQGLTQRQTCMT